MAEKTVARSKSQTTNNSTGKRRGDEASAQSSILSDSSEVTASSSVHPRPQLLPKRNTPNSSTCTTKKPKLSTENTIKPLKRKPQLQQNILTKKPNDLATDLPLKSPTLSNKKAHASTESRDLGTSKGNPNKRLNVRKHTKSRSRPLSTEFSLSSTSPPVLLNLRHSWHGMPAGLKAGRGYVDARSNPQRQRKAKLAQKGVRKTLGGYDNEDLRSEDETEILDLFPNERRILFNSLSVWLEMAEKRLELIERDLDEEPDDGHLLQRTKKTFQVFREETRVQEFKLTMIRQTCDSAIGIPGEDYRIAIRKWEVIKRKVTIHEQRLTLMSQGSGNLSKLYYWLNEADALLESYENVQENDGITSLRCRMERHKDFFKILDEKRHVIEDLQQRGTDGNVDIDEGVIWDVSQRFQTVEQSSQAAADRLSMEYYKNKVGQCIELCKEQLLDDNLKFGSQSQAEEAFNQHLKFFHEKRYIRKLSAYCKKLKDAVEKCRPVLSEEEQNDINQHLQNISKDFEDILQRMQADEQKLENIHRCWSEFSRAVELSLPWLVEAERLLKEGEPDQCRDYFMDFEDAQHDVTKATDSIKFLKRHSCGTVNVTLEQQVAMLDRRLRRVTRRYTRFVKSKHRDPKLESYECCVDEMMDWLDQSELAVNDDIDIGRLERLQEQVCTCEVLLDELNNNVSGVETVNDVGKDLMHDKNIASSIKATILNVNRRFDKLKTALPQKHKKLKQLQRLVHNVTSGLDEIHTWSEGTAKLLQKNLLFENFEEVKHLYEQYETQMTDYEKHAEKMKSKNNACSQIQNVVGEDGLHSYKEEIEKVNESWKFVQEHAETQHAKVRHAFITWERFEKALARLRDISRSTNKDENDVREGEDLCKEILQDKQELCSILEDEIGAKRVEEDANRVIEEWKRAGDDQKLVEWLTEVNSVFQEPLRIDSLENVEREIENHCRTKKALQDRTQVIEETVANANNLEEAGTLSETDIKGCLLEEMWDGVQESFSKRTQELEECVCLWTSYEEDMLHVMSSLTKGEMLLADAKSSQESTKDVLENLVDQIEAEKIKLQNTGEILKNMAMTAEKLKDKATSSGAAAIETKLNDATRLHNFLLEEVENHSDVLKDKIEKWETLHTRIQDLTSWVDATEEKLEMLKRSENLDGHSLTSIKEISTEILQRRQCLENLTEDGYEILDGCIDTESMETKKHLINLRQRWNALYQTTMECEVKTEVGLKPLQKFQVVCDEFEKWLETVEEKLERQMIKVGSTQELKQQLEACQVLADDLTSHTKNLDDLIWQGSQISSSGKLFSHSELKTKLKVVDERWQTSRTKVEERVAALRSIQDDFTDKELRFLEICDELDKIKESVRQEQLSEERTKETLENFWEIYEDAEEDISKLNEVLEPTVISFEELGQQYNIIDSEKLHERCNKLETKWREIRTVLPQRVTAVREEIAAWSEFYEKLEEFQLWLEEVKEMCDEWKIQENSAVMIQNLEKLQTGFRERQSDFEALVEESRHFRETVCDENERERLTATLTNLTQCWDEYSRWAAGRYQLTVLSNHYQKSSTAVVKYLDKIQSKMNAIEIPKPVAEKINEESEKAKVLVQDWSEKCQDLDVVFKDGHLVLEQKSLGESLAFDEELKNLDDHWKQVLNQVETQKHEVEVTARKWWDFTRNKMKMMRWLHRKENDAGLGEPLASSSVENPQEQLNNFEDILERINVRKSDLQMLNDAASSILETDPDEDISEFLNTVNERFVNLESEVARKRDYFGDLVKRWDKFSDRKRRISELFRGTSCVIAKKQIRTTDDVREQLVRCREAIVHLQSSETELSEVAEQGGKLMSELRNEGINVDKIEHELHTVVNRYNEMKNRAIKKEEVLQHVSVEMEKIDEGKMELESWLTDVHQQLNSVDEVAIVSQAIQHEVLEKRSLIRSVSAQVLKLQESSNEEAQLDLTAMLQPLHVQWRSLQNLVNPQNSSSESEQNIPSRWKSYSQDDLGSLDAFSEGLGLSRDDVMESGTELLFEEYYDGDLDNWINRLNEFRECLHGYMYGPEDALFEVEQKLNVVQKNLREELSSMMSDFEQERLQNSAQEKDEDVIKETDNKLQEIDSLFDCIASELERIELELQTVYECHVDYETAVQDWLTWFAEAKNKLSACQVEGTNEQSIDRKDQLIQSLSDEMDQVDLIDDVYTKGETLLNTVSDPVKTKLENQLAEFENDWAEFCGSVTECSNKIKEELKRQQTLNDWKEFNENSEAITTELKHFESLLSEEVPVVNSLDDVSEMLLKIQDVSQGLENERSKYEELKTRSVELLSQDAEMHNQTANKVESIDTLFNKVLQQAVVKQHSLEKAAVQLQHMDTGIKNLTEVVEEMESMLSPENTEISDADLRENIELYQTNLEVLESQKELIEILKQKEMSSIGKESKQPTRKLQEVVEKWTKVYEMTNERKATLIKEIESRESRQKTLNECVVTLRRTREVLNKDVKQCLSINEVESIRQALTELESCNATLNVLQSEINSNENKFSSAKTDREEVAAIISQCKAMKTSLSNKLEKLETILRHEDEFNTEVADLLRWISSTEDALVVDFYGLSEEDRQTAAVGQETLAKEFSAKKDTVEKLLRTGSELKSVNAEKISENVASKMAELSEKWKELEQTFSAQEEHVEECLRQQQEYYDAVEQLWEWMQGIGKRLNIQMEKSKPNYEQELVEYFSMVREMKDKSLLFENILKSGEKLSELLCEEEGSEIQEQLERLTSEWEILKSQVVERSKELTEILGQDAWLKVVQGNEEMLEELRALGIFEKRLNDNESELSCSSDVSELSVKVSAGETELNRSENVMKRNVREENTNQIIEPIVQDNSVPDGNKSGEIDSHDDAPSITDGTEAFVQILVLPTDNDETAVDSPADTDTSREDYLESCAQVPVDINSNTIESPTEHSDAENTEDSRAVVDLVPGESTPDETELFMNQIKDSEEFLDVTESKLSQLNEREGSEAVILELVKEFSDKDQEFENILETGMSLVRDISEDEQFAVEEKIITVEDRWKRIKDGLCKRKEAVETVSMLENRLQEFAKFVDEISEYLSGKEATQDWLYSDEEAGSILECYLGRLEREQIALKGLIEGTRDTLANVPGETGKQIEERLSRVSKNQTELARQLHEMKTALERWVEFSSILEGVEREVEALTSEFKDLADGEETEIIMESHLIESRVHMLKILLGSLEGKANTLRELSTKYKDVISSSNDCGEKYKKHKQNIAEKIALVADRLEKLDNYLESFKELEVEANELQVEVRQADEALSTLGENLSTFDEVDSRVSTLERLSEIKHLEEDILRLEPRVQLVKEKSMERLDKLDYENSGYWFQENVQCLVSGYEKARTRVKKNLESIEQQVSLKDQFEMKFLEMTAFLGIVEEYLNEDEEIPGNFDVTAKEVALLNGERFLREMKLKERSLGELVEIGEKLSEVERNNSRKEEALQLKERFNTRLKELRKNISCLDETLKCFNDFEQKVEELASLMYEAQGFLYGEGVETRGLIDLLELGRSCLENVEHKEGTLLELKNRVERLTESFKEEDTEVIMAEVVDLENKLASLKISVVNRISSLEALRSRRDLYQNELDEVRHGISSLEQEMKRNDGRGGENKPEVFSSLQKDQNPEESLSTQIPDEILLREQTNENFSQKLEEFRARLQNLNKMKTELEEECKESKVELDNVLALEPLELSFADLERINQEKANELRKYEEQENIMSAKVYELEEKFRELKTQYEEDEVHPEIVLETSGETNVLLQDVENALVDVGSVTSFTEERAKIVERLEAIRNDCMEMQKRLIGVNSSQLSKDCNSTPPQEMIKQQDSNTDSEAIHEVILPPPFDVLDEATCSNIAYNVNISDSQLSDGLNVTDNSLQHKLDKEIPASSENQEPTSQNDFQVLQGQVDTLANDEEILDIIISNSDVTSGSVSEKLETAKAKLELVKEKDSHLQIITSQAASMWDGIPTKSQGLFEENVIEIKEKLATAEECLATRIKMLEQCVHTKAMLQENLLDCYEILEGTEGEKYDLATAKEYVEVLQNPNNCLENASRLCFALNVVGDFEEAERVKEEIQDLRERWDKALEHAEQQIQEVTELDVSTEETLSINSRNEDPREDIQQHGHMENTILLTEQQKKTIEENVLASNAGSRENVCDVSQEFAVEMSSTLGLKQPEHLGMRNVDEGKLSEALVNGEDIERTSNVIAKIIVADENEHVTLDCINDKPKDDFPEEFMVKEIPFEDGAITIKAFELQVNTAKRTLPEKQIQDIMEENILAPSIADSQENKPETGLNGYQTINLRDSAVPSFLCLGSDEEIYKESKALEIEDVHHTLNKIQTTKERLQELTEKEEKIQKLSYEISELERRTLVPFKQTTHTDNTECWKFEEEIQKARNRLQKICNEIKSAFPELETHPANSRENELLRRSEYLLKEIDELSEKRTSMETIAECEKFVEEVKNVCDKPMTFCLDVVKMKKELAELGTISLELKDKEAKLQKVQLPNDDRATELSASLRHYAKVLETNEETMAGFLSALRHVLRSIQELKRITQDERENAENIQDIEVKCKNLEAKITEIESLEKKVQQLSSSLPTKENDVLQRQVFTLKSDLKLKMEQIENDRKRIDFERRLETLENNLTAFEDGMTKKDGNTAGFMKAFSEQFALVSEEVSQLADEGESLLSNDNANADGALSAKLQDVRSRFLRIQDLVEKQNEFERFENAAEDYRGKFDAVNSEISSDAQDIGNTHGSDKQEQLACLDEDFKALQQLAQEIIPSMSEQETTKINALLDELRTSSQMLKQRISREENALVGEPRNAKGLGKGIPVRGTKDVVEEDVCCTGETGDGTAMRFSDDSDEEHRMLRGSSDGSQYGSDSGMGDSLMNTLASEFTDGPSKTPTVSPINNIAQKEMDELSDRDTLCGEHSPINEHDIDRIVLTAQHIEDNAILNNIAQNPHPASHESSATVLRTHPSILGEMMKRDPGSESDSLEYLSLPQATVDKVTQPQDNIDDLELRTAPNENAELSDKTSSDSQPFIPAEFLLPEPAYQNQQDTRTVLSEQTPDEIIPSEQGSSQGSVENHCPQKSRDHDIDEELLLRSLASENANTNGGVGEGQGVVNGTEFPLISCAPPPMKSVEEFVEEPDALFQRLVDIEVMLKPQGKDEENLKSALLKHVALCVEMKNIQSKINVINRHGQYFMKKARSGLREILEERLKALNSQWDKLQEHASARQKDLEQLVQDKADNEVMSGEDSSLNALRNNTALLSSLYFNTENEDIKRLLNKLGLFSGGEDDNESQRHFDDDYLDYQSAFHDLFEWLTAAEEDIQSVSTAESEVKEMRERVKGLQDLWRQIQRKKPQLNEMVKKSEKFLDGSGENNEENVSELRHLWRDVMLKACSKLRDLQSVLHTAMMKELNIDVKEKFSKTLSESEVDVRDLFERLQECCSVDASEHPLLAVAQYQVFSSEADLLTSLLDSLRTSSHFTQSSSALNQLSNQIANVKDELESWRKRLNEAGALQNPVTTDLAEEDVGLEQIPEEPRSPRHRPKTWPEHSSLLLQVMEEVKKFEDWLKTAEENLQTFIGIAIPQTLNEMKSKLKEVQLIARNVHNKVTEMEYTLNSLTNSKDEKEYPELSEKCQSCLNRAKELKNRSDTRTSELKDIRFQWEMFESRFTEMIQWLERTRENLILPLKEKDEDSIEFVLGKLLKVREIEKKLAEKVTVKDDVLRQGEHVHTKTEAADVNVKIEQLREEWVGIENDLSKERGRLEKIMRLWNDYERKQEEMYEWLSGILSSLRVLEHQEKTIDVVKSQISLIQKHHDEIDNHLTLKESVDLSFHFLVDNIQGDVERLQHKQRKLNAHWQQLQALVSDRFDELVEVEWELEKANMATSLGELHNCVETVRKLVLAEVPLIGSSSLEEIKSLVVKYQNAKRELRSKQSKVDELRRKSKSENMDEERCTTLRQLIAQLGEDWEDVTSSLNEKEKSLKTSLDKWIDFQGQLTHLVDTDSWFATREAAMSKYQHISTEKDRNIALEDVKAMKGFLVTQKMSVTAFVESARGLLTEGLYDSEEIEGILGDIEERWMDINTKVNDCEEWLSEMSMKHKSCRDSIGSIMAFLDETELMLQSLASSGADFDSLISIRTKLSNLETELNGLRSTVYNLNSILVELNNVCDDSIIYELEKDIQELNQRYGSIGQKIKKHKAQNEEMISAFEAFNKDCTEMLAWLQCQCDVLDRENEEAEPPLLASELAQLKQCEELQREVDRQRDYLDAVRSHGQELKSKIKQGSLFVSPKLEKLEQRFNDFSMALNEKQERLKMRTSSWLQFCDKLQILDERIKESEKETYTTRYRDTKEHYRLLQKLIREAIQMRSELEELVEFTEENFHDKNSEQGKSARNEVEDLRERLEILTAELDSKKSEVETVQKLQAKFQEQCRHLNAVLQDAEGKLRNGDNAEHFHEQDQSFEFFQSNSEKYKDELLCAQRLAETLDQNTNVDSSTRLEVEAKFNDLKQRWENTCRSVQKHKESMDSRLVKWRDFKQKHKAFVNWLSEFESRPGLQPVASSDITELESQVEYVEACRKELDSHRGEFDLLRSTTEQCLTRSSDTVTDAVEKEYHEAEQRWLRVSECVASNQRTLELTLGDWQEYTTVMEDTMNWLRQTELYLKTCSAASLSDVEKYYERLKELSAEIEERRPHLELLTQRGRRLSRMSSYANADHVNNQVSVMGTLWTNVCTCLSTKMHCTIDSLHYLRKFMDNFESLSSWLHRLEDIVRRDWKHFYSCSPEEQRSKIKAYRKEIESHEAQRSAINDSTLQLIDKELGNELLRHIMEQRDALNERWEALCIQLGISYKKAEQTKYSLKLLEAQLTQLNKWMSSVERQITEISGEVSCDIDELSQQLVDLQISQREINARSPDVISVLSLCVRLQSCAFPDESGSRELQMARDSFELRWKNISRNVGHLLRQNQERVTLSKEFKDDYKQFVNWLRSFENQVMVPSGRCEDLHELSLEISRLQDLKRQVGAKGVLVERLLTRGNCLVNKSASSSAQLIRQMIGKVQERWYGITQELDDSITKYHLLSKDFVEFEEGRRGVNAWLTDVEVRLIGLEQVGNEIVNEEQRLQELKTLQHHINMKHGSLSDLTSQITKLKGCCSVSDYRLQQQKVEELKLRYEQALHYSLTLMLDLAVPSPFSSPDRVSTRLNFSETKP